MASFLSLSRFNTRPVWLTVVFLTVFFWTFVRLNFNSSSLTSQARSPGHISYTQPEGDESPRHAGPVVTHTPQFTELAASPLKIYIPPEPPLSEDILLDIWATPYHTKAQETELPADREAYHKALHCPVCANGEEKPFDESKCTKAVPETKECPKQPFDVTRCPNIKELNNRPQGKPPIPAADIPTSSPPSIEQDRPLVSYVYNESPGERKNLAFFVNHALHDQADFMFILNGPTTVDKDLIPQGRTNINIYKPKTKQENEKDCFQSYLGLHAEIIGKEGRDGRISISETYKHFILVGGNVKGPFIPRWSQECWTSALLSSLKDKNNKKKLVGTGLSCRKDEVPHLHPGILATDQEGLKLLFSLPSAQKAATPPRDTDTATDNNIDIKKCFPTLQETSLTNNLPTQRIRAAGFETSVLDIRWRQESEFLNLRCVKDDEWFKGLNIGHDAETEEMDPWEFMWVGVDVQADHGLHKHGHSILEVSSKRVAKSGYSSYEACKKEVI